MANFRWILSMVLTLAASIALAGTPAVDSPLPALNISERGELTIGPPSGGAKSLPGRDL